MDEALLVHVMTCNKASEMWVKLTSIYEQSTEMSLQILQGQFFSFKYDESKDIATHISNLTTLVNKIKEAGECISEAMVIARIIISLPRRFQHFVSAWESVPSANQNLNNLTSRLMAEEKRMFERKQNQNNSGVCMEKEYSVQGEEDIIYLKKNDKLYVEAIKNKNLFLINIKVDTRENCEENNLLAGYASGIRSIQDWHERLAHQNFQHVRSLLKSLNIEFKDDKNAFYDYCLQGKQCRQPFRISTTEVNELCNTISADLCGPMEVPSVGGSKYFLVLKDHYSKEGNPLCDNSKHKGRDYLEKVNQQIRRCYAGL
ncbi:hypothetical protein ILUMI_10279 [Ignelater luminosus]|uniref:GAG-pre-integrase domain-containing protein n=1 Tax=Ignelater luminosus TaxID=2038154 RepID=A0A8K0D0Q6_IGNLU|nr:hypothetical protein ILUMI_10279 [Ignelater luminosus]